MRQKIVILSLCGLMLSFVTILPVLGETLEPPGTETVQDYDMVFLSLSAVVAVIPFVVEMVKGFFPGLSGVATQVVAWVVGVGITMFGWWQHLGFLDGMEWYIALLYGLGSGLAANGIADTGFVQWFIGLFATKGKEA